ncbi:MAG: PKD-like domain-containing protein [Sphingobacteriales bacterium]
MKCRLLTCLFLLFSYWGFSQPCTLNVTLSQSAPTICSGNNITLTATATGGTAPYTYIWSTGEITRSINVDKAATYTVSVSDKTPGCQPVKQSVTIAISATPVAPTAMDVIVCANTPATLTAIAPGGNYQWYDAPVGGNFLASGASYTTPPIATSTPYYVETTVNGCTSTRTTVFANVSGKPVVTGDAICAGNVATLTASGGTGYTWYDAPAGGNLVGSGPAFTTPVLNVTTTYWVVVSSNGCNSAPTAVTASVTPHPVAPTASNVSVCSGNTANLHAVAPFGSFNWYSVPVGGVPLISSPDYTTPVLAATTTYYVENLLNGCASPRTQVTVTVNPIPQAPAIQNDTTCPGTSITLTAGADPLVTYQWYDAGTGGNLLATGPAYTTPVLNSPVTYYVLAGNGGCVSSRSAVNVTIRTQPAAPSVAGVIICKSSSATLTANGPGGIYSWYSAPVGGKLLATGPGYTTPPLNVSTTYYVQTVISGCVSARAPVTVTLLPAVPPPVAANTSVCSGSSAALSATSPANNYAWYDSAVGGTLLSTAQVYVTPALAATTTYYVESAINGCNSPRTSVKVTVDPLPSSPVASGVTICPGTATSLTATAAAGVIQWYDAPAGGNLLKTGATYNTPVLNATATYYVQCTTATCISLRTPVTVTINSVANPEFQYPFDTFCATGPNPTPVINNPNGGTFSAVPAGLVFVSTTTGEINIAASTPGHYTISFTSKGLCANTTFAKVAIVITTNASFSYSSPFCQNGPNPLPNFPPLGSSGTFTAAPAGLVFLNSSTGEIDLKKSQAGTYTITNTINASGACPANTATTTVTIDPVVIVSAGPNQTVKTGSMVQLAGSISGGTTTGTWSGGKGTFSNPNLPNAVYTPGPGETLATLTLTSTNPPGPCGAKSSKVTITITASPNNPTATGVSVCAGSVATLSATAPGGVYQWYDAAAGGNLLATGPDFTSPPLAANTTYYVQTTRGGVTSNRTAVLVTVNLPPAQPIAAAQQICTGNTTTLTANGSAGTYQWYDAAAGGNLLSQSNTYTTPSLTANTSYYVQATLNGCTSPRTQVNVTVTSIPNITSLATGTVCSGNPLNYTITADVATATFSWSRAKVAGISNPALANQNTGAISETLINTTVNNINVTYVIVPINGNCSGQPFNYVVTVYPSPIVTSPAKDTVCNATTVNYTIAFNIPATNFSWSRTAVPGISNATVSGQNAGTIKEVLYNTTNAPVDVNYVINYSTSTCAGAPFNLVTTVNPTPVVTSNAVGSACSGVAQDYVITSNVQNATFIWSRQALPNISNPSVANQTSPIINETLINTSSIRIDVVYEITPIVNGCPGTPFFYNAVLNPPIVVPTANSNSPVCVGSTINLRTNPVSNATYSWTGPDGFTSTLQSPGITNVSGLNAGTYALVVTVNGCSTLPVTTTVTVDQPPIVNAGTGKVVCIADPSILLNGSVTGGTTTGIWTTSGTGTFAPSNNSLIGQYLPTAADKATGQVVLTLTSTSKDNCNIAKDSVVFKFGPLPAVNAGPNQEVCSQAGSIPLKGATTVPGAIQWTSSGTGTFNPTANMLTPDYNPSPADVKSGSVTLTMHIIGAGVCYIPTDSMTVKFIPPPVVNAGGTRYVLKGRTITLHPTVSDNNVHYLWSPNIDINNDTLKNPVITGDIDRLYTLTVTDVRGCVNQDTARVIVSPPINIDNTFTPNGDGINDYWDITGLIAYVDATVDIFNRWGQKVFHSLGYPKSWDGTYSGKPLPAGVYYYVINTNYKGQVLSGWVTIIR